MNCRPRSEPMAPGRPPRIRNSGCGTWWVGGGPHRAVPGGTHCSTPKASSPRGPVGVGGGRSEAEARAAPSPRARSLPRDHIENDDLVHDASAACFPKVHRQPVSYAKSCVKKGHVLGLRNTWPLRCPKVACACVSHFVTPFNRLNFI